LLHARRDPRLSRKPNQLDIQAIELGSLPLGRLDLAEREALVTGQP
jgi:hypothetical protein